MTWTLTLNCEPVAKGRPRFGNGRTYTPKKTERAETEMKWLMREQFKIAPLDFALCVTIGIFLKPPKKTKNRFPCVRPDIDNYIKLVFDAGNGILWTDDNLIVSLHAHKLYSHAQEGIYITMGAA